MTRYSGLIAEKHLKIDARLDKLHKLITERRERVQELEERTKDEDQRMKDAELALRKLRIQITALRKRIARLERCRALATKSEHGLTLVEEFKSMSLVGTRG